MPFGDTIDQDLFSFLDNLFDQELHPLYGSANLRMVRPWQSTGFHTDSVLWPSEMGIERDTIGIEWHILNQQYDMWVCLFKWWWKQWWTSVVRYLSNKNADFSNQADWG